ncbi:MAG: FKBP-type peptidyl-prolyl cis-trans isomerase [Vicinamibacterales bacterium]
MKQFLTLASLCVLLVTFGACGGSDVAPSNTATADTGLSSITTLQTTDLVVGTGATATSGRPVSVHYTGWLYQATAIDNKGPKFDSSLDRGAPFSFTLGGQVIAGWNQGVPGMKVGGQRRLIIPPSLGYGASGQGSIPGNATLVFDVQLLAVN